ncbi:MAG: signal peptidase I [Lachnospiraceae bacterium]
MSKRKKLGVKIIIIFFLIIGSIWIREEGICLKVVVSGSMEPKISVGSICIIQKNYLAEKIKEGDIIAFLIDENTWITHRVVQISREGNFLTKGDANETVDFGWVTKKQYKGKIVGSIPWVGIFCIFFTQQKKIISLIIIIIFLWQEIERRKNIANKRRKEMDIGSKHLYGSSTRRK